MEIKKGICLDTDDFWYDIFEGGYIKPQNVLKNKKDIETVKTAIETLKLFKRSLDEADAVNYM